MTILFGASQDLYEKPNGEGRLMPNICILNTCEGNLKGVSLDIPKGRLVAFTGLSGSGKSTLLVDVLFNECQRQYLEALGLEGIRLSLIHISEPTRP